MNAHTTLEIGAWLLGALAVLLLSGGFVLGPAGERLGGRLYARESERIERRELLARLAAAQEDGGFAEPVEAARRWSVGEVFTRIAGHISDLALGIGRKGADR